MAKVEKTIRLLAEDVASQLGDEIVEISWKKDGSVPILECLLYREGGVSLDDCVEFSRMFGERLDQDADLDDAYRLEVGSPGLDRPIKTQDDMRRNLGKEVDVHLYVAVEGEKFYQGILARYDEESATLEIGEEEIVIPLKAISVMKLTIAF